MSVSKIRCKVRKKIKQLKQYENDKIEQEFLDFCYKSILYIKKKFDFIEESLIRQNLKLDETVMD